MILTKLTIKDRQELYDYLMENAPKDFICKDGNWIYYKNPEMAKHPDEDKFFGLQNMVNKTWREHLKKKLGLEHLPFSCNM